MQDCFRLHPEMYKSELEDDEDEVEEELRAQIASKESEGQTSESKQPTSADSVATEASRPEPASDKDLRHDALAGVAAVESTGDESGELVPRSMHDATSKD